MINIYQSAVWRQGGGMMPWEPFLERVVQPMSQSEQTKKERKKLFIGLMRGNITLFSNRYPSDLQTTWMLCPYWCFWNISLLCLELSRIPPKHFLNQSWTDLSAGQISVEKLLKGADLSSFSSRMYVHTMWIENCVKKNRCKTSKTSWTETRNLVF